MTAAIVVALCAAMTITAASILLADRPALAIVLLFPAAAGLWAAAIILGGR